MPGARKRVAVAGALSVAALLATSCASGSGPLGDGGIAGYLCVVGAVGTPVTWGQYTLDNTGGSPVTLTNIKLPPHAEGLAITRAAWLVPIYHDVKQNEWVIVGAGVPWPPTSQQVWPERTPAIGGVIRPHQTLNLLFGLIRTTPSAGRSENAGPVITYTTGGRSYTLTERSGMIIEPEPACH